MRIANASPMKSIRTVASAKFVDGSAAKIEELMALIAPEARLSSVESVADLGDVATIPGGRSIHHHEIEFSDGSALRISAGVLLYDDYDVLLIFEPRIPLVTRVRCFFGVQSVSDQNTIRYLESLADRMDSSDALFDKKWYFIDDFDRDHGVTWSKSFRD